MATPASSTGKTVLVHLGGKLAEATVLSEQGFSVAVQYPDGEVAVVSGLQIIPAAEDREAAPAVEPWYAPILTRHEQATRQAI